MDHNLAIACIGYGTIRMLRKTRAASAHHALATPLIMEEADPVQFCIDALKVDHPEWVADIDAETRKAIRVRLVEECTRALAH